MSGHGRSLDLDSPAYLEGVNMGNLFLDTGNGHTATDWIRLAESAKSIAHEREDAEWYHLAAGFADTLREFLEDQAS
jgi:hypothetical protein